jgi:hypothetical protein
MFPHSGRSAPGTPPNKPWSRRQFLVKLVRFNQQLRRSVSQNSIADISEQQLENTFRYYLYSYFFATKAALPF